MKAMLAAATALFLLNGCSISLVRPYDEAIEKGILEFQEQFNNVVKDAGDQAGSAAGKYEAWTKSYNALDSKIEILIQRASTASEGKACKLEAKLQAKIAQVLRNEIPAQLRSDAQAADGNAEGCNTRLLEIVKAQLESVRTIHSTTDKCKASDGSLVSCLRKASAAAITKIANQSIYAVYIVESSKK